MEKCCKQIFNNQLPVKFPVDLKYDSIMTKFNALMSIPNFLSVIKYHSDIHWLSKLNQSTKQQISGSHI